MTETARNYPLSWLLRDDSRGRQLPSRLGRGVCPSDRPLAFHWRRGPGARQLTPRPPSPAPRPPRREPLSLFPRRTTDVIFTGGRLPFQADFYHFFPSAFSSPLPLAARRGAIANQSAAIFPPARIDERGRAGGAAARSPAGDEKQPAHFSCLGVLEWAGRGAAGRWRRTPEVADQVRSQRAPTGSRDPRAARRGWRGEGGERSGA